MKKSYLFFCLVAVFVFFTCSVSFAKDSAFSTAIETCQKYSKSGDIARNGEVYNLLITLENKGNHCQYKEKITYGTNYSLLTCNFPKSALSYLANSMREYNDNFQPQIAKDNIYEAKLTNNYYIFEKYLANPQYCSITGSKK